MKKVLGTTGVVVAIALLAGITSLAAAAPSASIELLPPLPGDLMELDIGESHTFEIAIESDGPFILAMAVPDVYYPGRAIEFRGNDIAHRGESARLQLTMTGKGSTAAFEEVCGWPEPETDETICWPEGTVPVSIVVGVRYKANEVVMERFTFAVRVPRE